MRTLAAAMAMITIGAAPLPDAARVADLARSAMAQTGARQLAIAVVDRGQVVSVQAFGQRNLKGDPLTTRTAMYAASLTKAFFAYLVLQLVDEGRIDLDRPIASYLQKPLPEYGNLPRGMGNWGDLAGDERWRTITPRMALTHSTGFANFAFLEPDQKLRIHFQPGSRYAYSGEGLLLLQFMLSEGLGLDLQREFERRVFAPLGMTRSAIMWRDTLGDDMSSQWAADGSAIGHKFRDRVRVAGSADTSIGDMALFAAALVRGDRLKPAKSAGAEGRLAPDHDALAIPDARVRSSTGPSHSRLARRSGSCDLRGAAGTRLLQGWARRLYRQYDGVRGEAPTLRRDPVERRPR